MERPTGMRNRLVALSAVLAFAMAVAAVAVVAGSGGDDDRLEKLSFAFAGGAEGSTMAAGGFTAYPEFAPVEYRVRGQLPDLGDKAPGYRLADRTTDAAVARLASVVGLEGPVEKLGSGWVVRQGERELSVARVPGLPWHLAQRCADAPTGSGPSEGVVSSGCATAGVVVPDGAVSAPAVAPAPQRVVAPAPMQPTTTMVPCRGGTVECAPATAAPTTTSAPPCPPGASCAYAEDQPLRGGEPGAPVPAPAPPPPVRPADLPTRAEAERVARAFFTDLGVGLDDFELRDGFFEWQAGVQPRIAGLPTIGWGQSVSIGPKGRITSANGVLAEPERIGDYPLVTTAKALERLESGAAFDPRLLGGPMEGGATSGDDPECAKPTVICDPPPPVTTAPAEPPPPDSGGGCPPNAECFAPGSPPEPRPAPAAPPAPQVLTITGVRLALQHVGPALVPVYVFELEGPGPTSSPPVPAVTDEWIEDTRPPHPQPMPLAPGRPQPAPMPTVVDPVPPAGAEPGAAPTQVEGAPAPGR